MFVNIKEGSTPRQIERQKARYKGKYSKYGLCELCGKKILPGKHWSDIRCNISGRGLLLCKKCCGISEEMDNTKFLDTFVKNEEPERFKEYRASLKKEFPNRE
jgi:ribosome-binding protein aMBF1 (putative translation factor)